MGIDFCALVEYSKFGATQCKALDVYESEQMLPEWKGLYEVAKETGFHEFNFEQPWCWARETTVKHCVETKEQRIRPALPDSDWTLNTSAGFTLTFSERLCRIYHPLRWSIFIREPAWRHEMLKVLQTFVDRLEASAAVISHDCSAVVSSLNHSSLELAIIDAVNHWEAYETQRFEDVERVFPDSTDASGFRSEYNGFVRFK